MYTQELLRAIGGELAKCQNSSWLTAPHLHAYLREVYKPALDAPVTGCAKLLAEAMLGARAIRDVYRCLR